MLLDWFGEAGECAELIKKHLGHGHPLDMDKVKKELRATAFGIWLVWLQLLICYVLMCVKQTLKSYKKDILMVFLTKQA